MTDYFLGWERQAVCSVKSVVGNRVIVVVASSSLSLKSRDKIVNTCFYLYLIESQKGEKPILTIISQCPVSPLDGLPNFPHKTCAWPWVDPDEGLCMFTCQVNRCELSWDLTSPGITCVTIKVHDHYTTLSVPSV